MGGTFIRLCEQGHEVHVAYQTSGNIAVWDESADRHVDFVEEFCRAFGVGTMVSPGERAAGEIAERVRAFLKSKPAGAVDIPELQAVKGLIRRTEARAAARYSGVQGMCWLSDGRLASCGRDKKAVLWKGDGGKERDFPALGEIVLRVAVTSDRQRLLAGDLAGTLAVFSLDKGQLVGTPDTNPPTLEQRLEAARAAFDEIAALEKAAAEKAKLLSDAVQVAQSQLAEAQKSLDAATAEFESAKARQADAAKHVDRWKEELEFSRK
jgi:hypothetical protein